MDGFVTDKVSPSLLHDIFGRLTVARQKPMESVRTLVAWQLRIDDQNVAPAATQDEGCITSGCSAAHDDDVIIHPLDLLRDRQPASLPSLRKF